MSLDEIILRLEDRRLQRVAEATGLSYQTLRTIVNGENKNPTLSTIKALEDYLGKPNPISR